MSTTNKFLTLEGLEYYHNKLTNETAMGALELGIGVDTLKSLSSSAGVKGYYWYSINFDNKTVELTRTQGVQDSSFETGYQVGDWVTMENSIGTATYKYDKCAQITAVNKNIITLSEIPSTIPQDYDSDANKPAYTSADAVGGYIHNTRMFAVVGRYTLPEGDPDREHAIEVPDLGEIDFGEGAVAFGFQNSATLKGAFAEGLMNNAYGQYAHVEGKWNDAYTAAHAEGLNTKAQGFASHAEGQNTYAVGLAAHAEGNNTTANGEGSHAGGLNTLANGNSAFAHGKSDNNLDNTIIGSTTDSIVKYWTSSKFLMAQGNGAMATGVNSLALGNHAFAGGLRCRSLADSAVALGKESVASYYSSFALGDNCITAKNAQTVVGTWNSENKNAMFIVGNGSEDARKNIFEVLDDGIVINGVTLTSKKLQKILDFIDSIED